MCQANVKPSNTLRNPLSLETVITTKNNYVFPKLEYALTH